MAGIASEKKGHKKGNAMRCLLLGTALLVACSDAATPDRFDTDLPVTGRYAVDDSGVTMGWPGSGLAFTLPDGGDAVVTLTDSGDGYMDLDVDGHTRTIDLEPGMESYTLVEDAAPGTEVRLTRRTEHYDTGLFTINDLDAQGAVPTRFDGNILFLGDSITAGFGVAGDTRDCANTPVMHSPTESYAMLAADRLNADAHLIAVSGRGVVHNWDYNPEPVMPAQIDLALPDRPEGPEWDHALFPADVVVVTLGTNDWSAIDPGRDLFRQGYRDMLTDLRERHPEAHIVSVRGPLLTGEQGAAIRDGSDWATAQLGDPQISALDVALSDDGLAYSCNYHPGRESMRDMAEQLAAHIAARTELRDRPASERILPPDWMVADGKAHFAKRVDEIDAEPLRAGGVLLLGDSITEAWKWQPQQVADVVHNHGVGWDVVDGLRARWPQYASLSPEQVLVKIGTNDLSNDIAVEDIASDVRALVRDLEAEFPDARITLQSVLPREVAMRDRVDGLNARYAAVAEELNVEWLDLTEAFSAEDGSLRAELTNDGLHLLPSGYALWRQELLDHNARMDGSGG